MEGERKVKRKRERRLEGKKGVWKNKSKLDTRILYNHVIHTAFDILKEREKEKGSIGGNKEGKEEERERRLKGNRGVWKS